MIKFIQIKIKKLKIIKKIVKAKIKINNLPALEKIHQASLCL
jgi:hypothetical protein